LESRHKRNRSKVNEFLFAFNFFAFTLLKPITHKYQDYSTIILFIVAAIICLCSVLYAFKFRRTNYYSSFVFIAFIVYFCIIIDYLIRNNGVQPDIIYRFTIHGAIPLFLLSAVVDYNYVLKNYCIIAILTGLFFVVDPFFLYRWSWWYMIFGYGVMLPAFAGCLLQYHYYKKKTAIIPMILFFVELFICANKGAALSGIVLFIVSYIFFREDKRRLARRFFTMVTLGVTIMLFRIQLLKIFVKIAKILSLESYALTTLRIIESGGGDIIFGSRISIWEKVWKMIAVKPMFGYGVGYLESTSIQYAHNFILDVLVTFGFVGLFIILLLILASIIRMIGFSDSSKRVFVITMFVLSFIPMMFSLTFWDVDTFWVFVGICYSFRKSRRISYNEGINTKLQHGLSE